MAMFKRRAVLVAKIEAVAGVPESLTPATDGAMNIFNCTPGFPKDMIRRPMQGSNDFLASILGKKNAGLSFEAELVGKGTSGNPLWAATFLPCCGFKVATQTWSRTFDSADQKTCTIAWYQETAAGLARVHTWAGCVGNVDFELSNGMKGVPKFSFIGKYMSEDTAGTMPSITFPTTKPPLGIASMTFGSYTPLTQSLNIRSGNKVMLVPTLVADAATGGASGFAYGLVPEGESTAEIAPIALASRDFYALMAAGTTEAMSVVCGSASNNTMTFAAAAAQVDDRDLGEVDSVVTDVTKLMFNSHYTLQFS